MKKIVIIFLVLILIVILIWCLLFRLMGKPTLLGEEITSFEECLAAGYLILETYPRQRQIPGGEKFIERIEVQEESIEDQACIDSGGIVKGAMCCLSTSDFPNLCLIGNCGCSLVNSYEIKICDCGEGKCFDGNTCVVFQ